MIILGFFLSQLVTVWAFDYCSLNCKQPEARVHTLCGDKFPKGGGSSCGDWKLGLSKDVKKELLHLHNEARQKLASGGQEGYPSAADMRVMTWDGECAAIAQRWMDQCTVADGTHDQCFATEKGRAGQNLFWGTLPDDDKKAMARSLNGWYDTEAPLYVGAGLTVDKFQFSANSGHFTQVVWGSTTGLGCGLRKKKAATGRTSFQYSLTCNYFPAGNLLGVPIYKQGPPCAACPEGTSCSARYPALCGRPGDDEGAIGDDAKVGGGGGGGAAAHVAPALIIIQIVFMSIRYVKLG